MDIKNAFDIVSWAFTNQVIRSLGFPEVWISWIHNTIFQGTSQVLINGLRGKRIVLRRGVRQGDPLSSSLFIIAMDFLARYLQKLKDTGAIRLPFLEMRPCLLYADDALLFFKSETNQAQAIKIWLLVFQHVSGLQINLQKSKVIFTEVEQDVAMQLATTFGCRLATFPFIYLGISLSDK